MCVCYYVYTKCICITCLVCALLILCMLLRLTIQYRITRLCSSLDKPIDSTLSIPYLLLFLSVVLTPLTSTYLLASITFVLYTILNKSLFFWTHIKIIYCKPWTQKRCGTHYSCPEKLYEIISKNSVLFLDTMHWRNQLNKRDCKYIIYCTDNFQPTLSLFFTLYDWWGTVSLIWLFQFIKCL